LFIFGVNGIHLVLVLSLFILSLMSFKQNCRSSCRDLYWTECSVVQKWSHLGKFCLSFALPWTFTFCFGLFKFVQSNLVCRKPFTFNRGFFTWGFFIRGLYVGLEVFGMSFLIGCFFFDPKKCDHFAKILHTA